MNISMKTITLSVAFTLVLHSLACGAFQRPAATPAPSPTPEYVVLDENGASPEALTKLKSLLYSDEPLDKVMWDIKPDSPGANEEPWRSFALSLTHTKQGRPEEAKKDLRRVLAMPDPETRMLLWAWAGLRALGERPPAGVADKVQGVVCELHNEAGVGTIAAYADGRARWLGGKGAVTFWEAPGDKEVDALVNDLLKSVEPLVKRAPAVEKRMATEIELEHFRVTILTFGGLHVIDVYGPDLHGKAGYLLPSLMASVRLLDGLSKKNPEKKQ